jgi:acyl carrier protein
MVPSDWMVLDQLPITANGKLDRSAFPRPQSRPEELGEYVAPRDGVERALATIWAELLQVDQVGAEDNFFELGGHSLHAMKLIARIANELSIRLSAVMVFQYPTIDGLAAIVKSLRPKPIDISKESEPAIEEGVM